LFSSETANRVLLDCTMSYPGKCEIYASKYVFPACKDAFLHPTGTEQNRTELNCNARVMSGLRLCRGQCEWFALGWGVGALRNVTVACVVMTPWLECESFVTKTEASHGRTDRHTRRSVAGLGKHCQPPVSVTALRGGGCPRAPYDVNARQVSKSGS
jgi:hypothetical protein